MLGALTALLLTTGALEPDPTKLPKPPSVHFKGKSPYGGLQFEVANPNFAPIYYVGYPEQEKRNGVIAPLFEVNVLRNQQWEWCSEMGRCGVGLRYIPIPARSTVTFTSSVLRGQWDEVRVGLIWADKQHAARNAIAWSAGIERAAVATKK